MISPNLSERRDTHHWSSIYNQHCSPGLPTLWSTFHETQCFPYNYGPVRDSSPLSELFPGLRQLPS